MMNRARPEWMLSALLLVFVIVSYLPAFTAGTIWDDQAALANPILGSTSGFVSIWSTPRANPFEEHYWPVSYTVFWALHRIVGQTALWAYHGLNVILHGFNSILMYILARRLRIAAAWAGAALFALHPIQVESVGWIIELKNVLSFTFAVWALERWIQWLQSQTNKLWLAWQAVLLFALGMLTKSAVAMTPFVAALLLIWRFPQRCRRALLPLGIWLLMAILLVALDFSVVSGAQKPVETLSLFDRVALVGQTSWFYVIKLMWPQSLCAIYPKWTPLERGYVLSFIPTGLFVAFLTILAYLAQSRLRSKGCFQEANGHDEGQSEDHAWSSKSPTVRATDVLFALGGFLIFLLPTSGLIPFSYQRQSFVADRFAYHASPFFFMGIAAGANILLSRFRLPLWTRLFLLASVLTILSSATFGRARLFSSVERLALDTLAKNPKATMPRYYLADAMARRQDYGNALQHFSMTFWQSTAEIAATNATFLKEASQLVAKASNHPSAQFNYGLALASAGKLEEAERAFARAIEIQPSLSEARIGRAVILARLGQTTAALEQLSGLYSGLP